MFLGSFLPHHLFKKTFFVPTNLEDIYSFTVVFRAMSIEKKTFQHIYIEKKTLYSYLLKNKYNKTVQKQIEIQHLLLRLL